MDSGNDSKPRANRKRARLKGKYVKEHGSVSRAPGARAREGPGSRSRPFGRAAGRCASKAQVPSKRERRGPSREPVAKPGPEQAGATSLYYVHGGAHSVQSGPDG